MRDESWSIVGEFVPCVFNCVSFLRTVDYTLLKRTFFQVYSEQPLFHPLYFFYSYRFLLCCREHVINYTSFSNGYLGSCIDEERSEMRYVMRIAEFRESSNL